MAEKIESLVLTARTLGRQLGVEVVVATVETAATNGKKVVIDPKWLITTKPENVPILRGLLDHEVVGHNLHTNFGFSEHRKPGVSALRCNADAILEDIRIEVAASKVYPGVGLNLGKCVRAMCEHTDIFGPEKIEDPSSIDPIRVVSNLLLIGGRSLISSLQAEALKTRRDLWVGIANQMFGSKAVNACLDICERAKTSPSTEDVWRLSGEIEKIFKDLAQQKQQQKPQPQKGDPGESDDSGESSSGDGESGSGESKSKAKSKSKSKPKGKDKGERAEDGAGSGQDESQDQGAQGGDAQSSGSGDQDAVDPNPGEATQAAKQALGASQLETPSIDLGDMIKNALSKEQEKVSNSLGMNEIFVRDVVPRDGGLEYIPDLSQMIRLKLGSNLEEILEAMALRWNENAYSGRRLDNRRLSRIPTGEFKVFRKKHEEEAIDTAVYILVDGSGSMIGSMGTFAWKQITRFDAAFSVVKALGDVLTAGDVPFGVSVFGNYLVEVKGFDTPWLKAQNNFKHVWGGSTILGPSVSKCLANVSARPEQRKLFVLLTDGDVGEREAEMVVNDMKQGYDLYDVDSSLVMITNGKSNLVKTARKNGIRADIVGDVSRLAEHVLTAVKQTITSKR